MKMIIFVAVMVSRSLFYSVQTCFRFLKGGATGGPPSGLSNSRWQFSMFLESMELPLQIVHHPPSPPSPRNSLLVTASKVIHQSLPSATGRRKGGSGYVKRNRV